MCFDEGSAAPFLKGSYRRSRVPSSGPGYGTTAETSFDKMLSFPGVSYAVTAKK